MATGVRVEEVTTVTYGEGASVRDPWPVSWSAVWVGTLSAVALALVFGLAGTALGAHQVGHPFATWKDVSFLALAWTVFGAFLSFALGGWTAARVGGFRRSETAMLHGAIAWMVAVPILLVLASMGAAAYFGSWYSGLAGTPVWVAAPTAAAVQDPAAAAIAARNTATAAVTALLLGLVGGVIGGWMGSGEPMTFTYYRTRPARSGTGGW
jgi:outer membrane lipoprotein SlyB